MPQRSSVTIREAEPGRDDDVVVRLKAAYMSWAHERLAREFNVHDPPADPAEIHERLHDYRPPQGQILVAECDRTAAGIGALRMLDRDVAEVKRTYVDPAWRDCHVGSTILDRLLDEARTRGARTVRLDTCRFMTAAQGLYRSRGFLERPAYEGTEIPERLQQHWIFFERQL
jgi:N-acetylglutamate synthase-like GNAT family acetyltransferase